MSDQKRNDLTVDSAELRRILDNVPEDVLAEVLADKIQQSPQQEVKKVVQAVSQHFSGPVPPPHILGEYDDVQKGFAERIVMMAEKEQMHRHSIENRALQASIGTEKRGQKYAYVLSLLILFGSMGLIYSGREISGSILAGSTLIGLAYVFITGRKREDSEATE